MRVLGSGISGRNRTGSQSKNAIQANVGRRRHVDLSLAANLRWP